MAKRMKQAVHKKDIPQLSSTPTSLKKIGDRFTEKERKKDVPPPRMQFDDTNRVEKSKRRSLIKKNETINRVELFRHLPQYDYGTQLPDLALRVFELEPMHPAVLKVILLNTGAVTRDRSKTYHIALPFLFCIGPPYLSEFYDAIMLINNFYYMMTGQDNQPMIAARKV